MTNMSGGPMNEPGDMKWSVRWFHGGCQSVHGFNEVVCGCFSWH